MVNIHAFNNIFKKEFTEQLDLIKKLINKWNKEKAEIEKIILFQMVCEFHNIPQSIIDLLIYIEDSRIYIDLVYNRFINKYYSRKECDKYDNIYIPNNLKKWVSVNIYTLVNDNYNNYISEEFYYKNTWYIFNNNWKPLIISKWWNWFFWWKNQSDYTRITKSDVIFLSSLELSHFNKFSWHYFKRYFSIKVPKSIFKWNINKNVIEYIKYILPAYEFINNINHEKKYEYNYFVNRKLFNQFKNNIDSKNNILIKCLYYYIKASAISDNEMFQEEQLGLLYFALDWIIKLFMNKHKANKVNQVSNILVKEYWFYKIDWILEELYKDRVEYVHPVNDFSSDWCLKYSWSWYEIKEIIKDLLYIYILWYYIKDN